MAGHYLCPELFKVFISSWGISLLLYGSINSYNKLLDFKLSQVKVLRRFWDFLPYEQAENLACHSLIDAGKRHETFGLEIKNFITHSTSGSISFMFVWISLTPQIPQGLCRNDPKWVLYVQWIYVITKEPWV